MAQYREYSQIVSASDTEIILTASIAGHQNQIVVTRGGSEVADFETASSALLAIALGANPTTTSQPCTVYTKGKWLKNYPAAAITTTTATIAVPVGNSGTLRFQRDAGAFTALYSHNSGTFTTITDGGTLVVADGDSLAIRATDIPEQETANGTVYDDDTGIAIDNFALNNTSPIP